MTPRLADSGCVRYVDLTTLSKTNVAINVTCIVVSDNMSNMAVGKYCVFVCLFVFVYLCDCLFVCLLVFFTFLDTVCLTTFCPKFLKFVY